MVMASTFLNLSKADRDRYIYRIIPIDRLYELFATGENVLAAPSRWQDPFERTVLSVVFPRANLYGQCWTRHNASDAMWRIYSPKSTGVRMRTAVQVLAASLSLGMKGTNTYSFIGAVKYPRELEIIAFAHRRVLPTKVAEPEEQARTLLLKRRAFRHEREVRLIWVGTTKTGSNGLARYPIDPHSVISQLMLDPRLERKKAERLQDAIHERTGFPRAKILRSLLYTLPPQLAGFAVAGTAV